MRVGDVVMVGPAFHMSVGVSPAHYAADKWTGRTLRIVALRRANTEFGTCASAALADPLLAGADESDEIVDISIRRLSLA